MFKIMLILAMAAPPMLEIPAEIKSVEQYVRFTPKTDAKTIIYIGLSGLDPFPSDELKDSRRFFLPTQGIKAGRYKFAAIASSATGEQARADFTVVWGDSPVNPVDPPIPPAPPDPLVAVLQAAYSADPDNRPGTTDKANNKAKLAALYKKAQDTASNKAVTTWAQLHAALSEAGKSTVGDPATVLPGTRKAIQSRLREVFPVDATLALGDLDRLAAGKVFTQIATALEAVK